MTGTVTTMDTVNLRTYTSDRSLAATYPIAVTATLSGYPHTTPAPATLNFTLKVVDPCETATIPPLPIPPIS